MLSFGRSFLKKTEDWNLQFYNFTHGFILILNLDLLRRGTCCPEYLESGRIEEVQKITYQGASQLMPNSFNILIVITTFLVN
jgi:hypothetical protein